MKATAFSEMPKPKENEYANNYWDRLTLTQKSALVPSRTVQYLQCDFILLSYGEKTSIYNFMAEAVTK